MTAKPVALLLADLGGEPTGHHRAVGRLGRHLPGRDCLPVDRHHRLKAGRYRLRAIVDPANWFAETNNANNGTWVDLPLTGSGVRVVAYGPAT